MPNFFETIFEKIFRPNTSPKKSSEINELGGHNLNAKEETKDAINEAVKLIKEAVKLINEVVKLYESINDVDKNTDINMSMSMSIYSLVANDRIGSRKYIMIILRAKIRSKNLITDANEASKKARQSLAKSKKLKDNANKSISFANKAIDFANKATEYAAEAKVGCYFIFACKAKKKYLEYRDSGQNSLKTEEATKKYEEAKEKYEEAKEKYEEIKNINSTNTENSK